MKLTKMPKVVFLYLGCTLLILLCGNGCLDQSLDPVPVIEVEEFDRKEPFSFQDSVPLDEGLLHRRLVENGYDEIYGLGKFIFPTIAPEEQPSYDVFLISCRHGLERVRLLTTVNRKYKSVLDIFSINPGEQRILQLYPNPNLKGGLVVDLVSMERTSEHVQQMFRLEVDAEGIIRQLE